MDESEEEQVYYGKEKGVMDAKTDDNSGSGTQGDSVMVMVNGTTKLMGDTCETSVDYAIAAPRQSYAVAPRTARPTSWNQKQVPNAGIIIIVPIDTTFC